MYYHASPVSGIRVLNPETSNHNVPLVYLSRKRENVLVYLSNAVEKYCKEAGFLHNGKWHKWATYGFDQQGIPVIDEYYPNALEETYKGVSGYIYSVDSICGVDAGINICNAVVSEKPVVVTGCEFIEDAYNEIIKAEKAGRIKIRRYEDLDQNMLSWIEDVINKEYDEAKESPDYRFFLEAKFSFLNKEGVFFG